MDLLLVDVKGRLLWISANNKSILFLQNYAEADVIIAYSDEMTGLQNLLVFFYTLWHVNMEVLDKVSFILRPRN